MSTARSFAVARHSPLLNTAIAGAACAIALTLAAGPAMAQATPKMERVEVSGHVITAPARHDVRASCERIEAALEDQLAVTWNRERRLGEVKVNFVLDGNQITGVSARGISHKVARDVSKAVRELRCSDAQSVAGAQIYSFRVAFVDPYSPGAFSGERRDSGSRVALLTD